MNLTVSKGSLYDYLFCILILAIPFSLKLPNVLLIALTLFFIIDYKRIQKLDFSRLLQPQFVFLGILLLYWLIKGLFTGTIGENKYSLLLPIILIPLLILKVQDFYKILIAIVICGFIISTRALYGVFSNYLKFNEFLPFEGTSVNEILYMERPYLGFFLIISALIAVFMATKIPKIKFIVTLYCLYIIVTIFLISARMSILTLGTVLFLYVLFYLKIATKKLLIYLSIFLLVIIVLIGLNKNLQERLFITSDYGESIEKFKRHEPRFIIWPCSYSIVKSPTFDKFFGLESERKSDELLADCYVTTIDNKHRANFFIETDLNTHNQFIGTFLTSGFLGFFLLFTFFIVQLYRGRKNYFATAIIISVLLFLVVENVLYRQIGVYFFALLIVLINIPEFNSKREHAISKCE
ncbi:O-antigen ligase family protein [Flavobacterium antarcticum]|uniref:O-antigen ligase family protein n=1 Tax=Flavobacterium antarcticum TaxID=271155 RepID=UPI0003B4BEE7|nr:O-antigen ligase family protein [Flavobacterium antarcticum]